MFNLVWQSSSVYSVPSHLNRAGEHPRSTESLMEVSRVDAGEVHLIQTHIPIQKHLVTLSFMPSRELHQRKVRHLSIHLNQQNLQDSEGMYPDPLQKGQG